LSDGAVAAGASDGLRCGAPRLRWPTWEEDAPVASSCRAGIRERQVGLVEHGGLRGSNAFAAATSWQLPPFPPYRPHPWPCGVACEVEGGDGHGGAAAPGWTCSARERAGMCAAVRWQTPVLPCRGRQGGPHSVLCCARVDRRMNRESPEDFGSGEGADGPCHELA
jgi:hypothetical protein